MRYGISMPNFGEYGDARLLAELAREAEAAGWDGFFPWDHLQYFVPGEKVPVVDVWIALTAAALRTDRIRLGPLVTPLARRRPWTLARQTATLDRLGGGRLILGVGLGEPPETDFASLGEDPDPRVRARKLDEGLAVLTGLWSGEPFSFDGEFYHVREALFQPPPVQSPRIPIWVGGWWPRTAPMRRAARWDGVCPLKAAADGFPTLTPPEVRDLIAYVGQHRTSAAPFDVVIGGETPGDDRRRAAETVAAYAEAGATWWVEGLSGYRGPLAAMRERARQGPPAA
jgi:alkanesulfonate monooxygenase SsuD/methylene tetrahydromethanopterin reductase-like flavin-dependent oxidoreductase (luciferase family)